MFKRRWLKTLAIALGLVVFVGYFAFRTYLFPPLERAWEFDLAALIPRDVDFFLAKAELRRDFDPFPRLAAMDTVEGTDAWKTLEASPEFAEFKLQSDVDRRLGELRAQLERIPLGMDPLKIFGGRDLAIAGRFRGASLEQADWAVYARVNWAGKLVIALLAYPGLVGLEAQGLAVARQEQAFQLSGGALTRPLWITRVRDVAVIGTSQELVQKAHDLAQRRGQDSLFMSADYGDNIDRIERAPRRDEFEVIVDLRALLANLGHSGPWPDTHSERFMPAFLGRIFQAPSCKKAMGVVGFDEGLRVDLYGGFSSEQISDAQRRIYSREGFSQKKILEEIATLAPADCAMFVYLHGPIGVLLKQVFASVEPALRSNLQDAFRQMGRYDDLDQLIEDLSGSLYNRLALIVRANDYDPDPKDMQADPETGELVYVGPPHDDQPVFAVALVTWYSDEQELVRLRDEIGDNAGLFGCRGQPIIRMENGKEIIVGHSSGYYSNSIANFETREFWAPLVPGTGVVATMNTTEHVYITNNYRMLRQLLWTNSEGQSRGYPRLSERPDFQALLTSATAVPKANMLVWIDPRAAGPTLREQAAYRARDMASRNIDWRRKRAEEEARVVRERFPGRSRSNLSEQERTLLDGIVTPRLQRYRSDFIEERAPQLEEEMTRQVDYAEAMSAILLLLQLDLRSFRLSLRVSAPLD